MTKSELTAYPGINYFTNVKERISERQDDSSDINMLSNSD